MPSLLTLRRPTSESIEPVNGFSPLGHRFSLDLIVAAYVAATVVVVLLGAARIPGAMLIAGAHVAGFVLYVLLRRWSTRSAAGRIVFFCSLFLLVLAIFEGMGAILPHLHADVIEDLGNDAALAEMDVDLFGSDPTTWFGPVLTPATVFLLQFCYTSYFFLPIILTVLVLARRKYLSFLSYAAIIVGTFFTTYVGYYLVPAYGPRVFYEYPTEIPHGAASQVIYDTIDALDYIKLNAFPSGHTAVTIVYLAILFYESKRLAWVLSPLVVGLILATLALRYHYLVDVVAGALCAALWIPWGMRLVFKYDHGRARSAQ